MNVTSLDWVPTATRSMFQRVRENDEEGFQRKWSNRQAHLDKGNSSFFSGMTERCTTVTAVAAVVDRDYPKATEWLTSGCDAATTALQMHDPVDLGDVAVYASMALISGHPALRTEVAALTPDVWNVEWAEAPQAMEHLTRTLVAFVQHQPAAAATETRTMVGLLTDPTTPPSTVEYLTGIGDLATIAAATTTTTLEELTAAVTARDTAFESYLRARRSDLSPGGILDWRGLALVAAAAHNHNLDTATITATFLPTKLITR